MLESLARWIFDLRPQILGILSALTLYASFLATRVTLEGVHPEAPPSDPAIKFAAETYDGAFPAPQTLAVLATTLGEASFNSAEGRAWLDQLQTAIGGLRVRIAGAPVPQSLLAAETSASRRTAPDGHSALIEGQIKPDVALDAAELGNRLAAMSMGSGVGAHYKLALLTPSPETGVLSNWVSSAGPLLAGAALLTAGLLAYSASFTVTGLTAGAALLAILWQIGVWAMLGGHFYTGMRFIPLLVFALTLGHGFPIARHVMRALAAGATPAEAAASMVRRLAPGGGAALIAVALALLAASMAPVPNARAALAFAALGALFAFPALFIVMPLLMSGAPVDRPPAETFSDAALRKGRRTRPELSLRQAAAGPQTIAIVAAAFALIAGLESHARLFGPIDSAELEGGASRSWVETANEAARGPGSTLASLSVIGRTSPEACMRFDVLDAMDRLSWRLANLPGVTGVDSLAFRLRQLQAEAHGGDLRWQGLPRAPVGALQSMTKIPDSEALYDHQCRTLVIRVYLAPPFAGALEAVDAAVTRFRAENAPAAINFELAGGPLATALSEQRILTQNEIGIFLAVMTALAGVAFFSLKDWRAATAVTMMGLGLFLAAGWAVAAIPIGLTGHTVPLLLFTLLLSVDMAVYVLIGWRMAGAVGASGNEPPRRRLWQRDARALVSRALSLLLCFTVWLAASDQLSRDLGLLAIVTTIAGTVTALVIIPAASMLAERSLARRIAGSG